MLCVIKNVWLLGSAACSCMEGWNVSEQSMRSKCFGESGNQYHYSSMISMQYMSVGEGREEEGWGLHVYESDHGEEGSWSWNRGKTWVQSVQHSSAPLVAASHPSEPHVEFLRNVKSTLLTRKSFHYRASHLIKPRSQKRGDVISIFLSFLLTAPLSEVADIVLNMGLGIHRILILLDLTRASLWLHNIHGSVTLFHQDNK